MFPLSGCFYLCGGDRVNAPQEHSDWLILERLKHLFLVHRFCNSIDGNLPMPQRNSAAWITIMSLANYGLLTFLKSGLDNIHCCYVKINYKY